MARICPGCGNEVADGLKFCTECGRAMEPAAETSSRSLIDDAYGAIPQGMDDPVAGFDRERDYSQSGYGQPYRSSASQSKVEESSGDDAQAEPPSASGAASTPTQGDAGDGYGEYSGYEYRSLGDDWDSAESYPAGGTPAERARKVAESGAGQKTGNRKAVKVLAGVVVAAVVVVVAAFVAIGPSSDVGEEASAITAFSDLQSEMETSMKDAQALADQVEEEEALRKAEADAAAEAVWGDEEVCDILASMRDCDYFEPQTVTGTGDSTVEVPLEGAQMLIVVEYSGSGDFSLSTVDEDGEEVDCLATSSGSYSGTVTTWADHEDVVAVEITADGDWSVTFEPMGYMEELVAGQTYSGDCVLYVDAETVETLSISNSGGANFIVRAYGFSHVNTLVITSGSYEGTVEWEEPQFFLIVESGGTWSVSW